MCVCVHVWETLLTVTFIPLHLLSLLCHHPLSVLTSCHFSLLLFPPFIFFLSDSTPPADRLSSWQEPKSVRGGGCDWGGGGSKKSHQHAGSQMKHMLSKWLYVPPPPSPHTHVRAHTDENAPHQKHILPHYTHHEYSLEPHSCLLSRSFLPPSFPFSPPLCPPWKSMPITSKPTTTMIFFK